MAFKIKQICEDFVVREIPRFKKKDKGNYFYYLLKKRDCTTIDAIEKIAINLRMNPKNIGFAGNKDKNAVTEQVISIFRGEVKDLKLHDISIKYVGKGDEPVSLGDLEGNMFEITVRNLNKNVKIKKINNFTNYFGEQRFSKNNVEIGKNLVKRNFGGAVELILKNRDKYQNRIKNHLQNNKNDYIGALRTVNKKIMLLYIHAYQSYLWNKTAKLYLKKNKKNIEIPVIGFGTEMKNKEISKMIDNILTKEKVNLRDFIFREFPEISSEGGERKLFAEIKDLKIERLQKGGLNKNKYKIKLKFTLGKGCYATVAVNELVNPN